MNIQEQYYSIILDEFKNIEDFCKTDVPPDDKLYFFSASYGVINRVMNFESNPTLIFMHQILSAVHQTISQRLNSPKKPGVISSSLPNNMWDALFLYFSELVIAFEEKDTSKIYSVLEKFSNLTYATTGNGFYLYLNEKINL